MKDLSILSNDYLGKVFWSLWSNPMDLSILVDIVVRCLQFSLLSKIIPRCFRNKLSSTGLLLKSNTE